MRDWLGFKKIMVPFLQTVAAVFAIFRSVVGAVVFVYRFIERSIAPTRSQDVQDTRAILIEAIRAQWIQGILEPTLRDSEFPVAIRPSPNHAGNGHVIELSTEEYSKHRPILLRRLLNVIIRRRDVTRHVQNASESIHYIFDDVSRQLLILGAPGSGKTVLLLQLAESLLKNAKRDKSLGVPVVLNLASWDARSTSVEKWITHELRRQYGVSILLAKDWVQKDSLIYLLDGLDEVAGDHHSAALNSLNGFIKPTSQIAICSRTEEYETLQAKLKVYSAVEIQPVESQQAKSILRQHLSKENVRAIANALEHDEDVWEEAKKPLFLNMLVTTYARGAQFSSQRVAGSSEQKVQQLVVAPYVRDRLRNRTGGVYSNEEIWRYLAWIGSNLKKRSATQFTVEMIQWDWVHTGQAIAVSRLSPYALLRRRRIDLGWRAETVSFRQDGCRAVMRLAVECFRPSKILIVVGIVMLSLLALSSNPMPVNIVMVFGLYSFSVVKSFLATFWPFKKRKISARSEFNQGLQDASRLGLVGAMKTGLSMGLISIVGFLMPAIIVSFATANDTFSLVAMLNAFIHPILLPLCAYGTLWGASEELVIGNWQHVLNHTLLRTVVWRKGLAPRRYDRFLQTVVDQRLMRRVGGSVFFVHRYVQEYFADQWVKKYSKQDED